MQKLIKRCPCRVAASFRQSQSKVQLPGIRQCNLLQRQNLAIGRLFPRECWQCTSVALRVTAEESALSQQLRLSVRPDPLTLYAGGRAGSLMFDHKRCILCGMFSLCADHGSIKSRHHSHTSGTCGMRTCGHVQPFAGNFCHLSAAGEFFCMEECPLLQVQLACTPA